MEGDRRPWLGRSVCQPYPEGGQYPVPCGVLGYGKGREPVSDDGGRVRKDQLLKVK